jgi:hypothetical protein
MTRSPTKISWADWRQRLPYRRYLNFEECPRRLRGQFFSLLPLRRGWFYLVWLTGLTICCGRLRQIIHTDLLTVKKLDCEAYQVNVPDNNGSPAIAALAQSLGLHYHSRELQGSPLTNNKIGNLNFGLIVGQI